jgi:hypothetical protein
VDIAKSRIRLLTLPWAQINSTQSRNIAAKTTVQFGVWSRWCRGPHEVRFFLKRRNGDERTRSYIHAGGGQLEEMGDINTLFP